MANTKTSLSQAKRYRLRKSEEWKSLLTHLDFAEGFALIIVLAPDSYGVRVCREALKRRFARHKSKLQVIRIAVDEPPEKLAEVIASATIKAAAAIWIQMERGALPPDNLLGIEPFDAAEREAFGKALRALNPERNQLRRTISVPLIFAGPVWLQTIFRESAPDLWSVRTTVVNIQLSADDLVESSIGLQMPHEKHFAPPDRDTEVRADQLRHDIKILERKPGRELLRAELLRRLGVELTNLLLWEEAEQTLNESYELHQNHHAPQSDLALVARDLGRLLRKKGKAVPAKHYFEVGLEAEKLAFGKYHPRYSRALTDLGSLLQDLGDFAQAERLLREALDISKIRDPEGRAAAVDLSNLALLLNQTGHSKDAEALFRNALVIISKLQPPEPANEATIIDNLAATLRRLGNLEEAEQLSRRALALTEASVGPDHPDTAIRLANFATLLDQMGRWPEAEVAARRALELDEKCYGKQHPLVALNLINLASGLLDHGQPTRAEPIAGRALAILVRWNRENKRLHPDFSYAQQLYSSILAKRGVGKSRISQRLRDVTEGKKVRNIKHRISRKRNRLHTVL